MESWRRLSRVLRRSCLPERDATETACESRSGMEFSRVRRRAAAADDVSTLQIQMGYYISYSKGRADS